MRDVRRSGRGGQVCGLCFPRRTTVRRMVRQFFCQCKIHKLEINPTVFEVEEACRRLLVPNEPMSCLDVPFRFSSAVSESELKVHRRPVASVVIATSASWKAKILLKQSYHTTNDLFMYHSSSITALYKRK